jgi:hypothetical protein
MPLRKYTNDAEKQKAYRERLKAKTHGGVAVFSGEHTKPIEPSKPISTIIGTNPTPLQDLEEICKVRTTQIFAMPLDEDVKLHYLNEWLKSCTGCSRKNNCVFLKNLHSSRL